jgi:hypothetical protein
VAPRSAGYSGTPLVAKLGIKAGSSIAIVGAPRGYSAVLGPLPVGVVRRASIEGREPFDLIHAFVRRSAQLGGIFRAAKRALKKNGALWMSWPKKSSGAPTDLDENVIRHAGLAHGLVDVKVCAVDETWSGLKFVYRLSDR